MSRRTKIWAIAWVAAASILVRFDAPRVEVGVASARADWKGKANEYFEEAVNWTANKLQATVVKALQYVANGCERGVGAAGEWLTSNLLTPFGRSVHQSAMGPRLTRVFGLVTTCGGEFAKGLLCTIPRRLADLSYLVTEVSKTAAKEGCVKKAWKDKSPLTFLKCGFKSWIKDTAKKVYGCLSAMPGAKILDLLLESGGRAMCRFGGELVSGLIIGALTGGTTFAATVASLAGKALKLTDASKLLASVGYPGSKLVSKHVPDKVVNGFVEFAKTSAIAACKGEPAPEPPKENEENGEGEKTAQSDSNTDQGGGGGETNQSCDPSSGSCEANTAQTDTNGEAPPATDASGGNEPTGGDAPADPTTPQPVSADDPNQGGNASPDGTATDGSSDAQPVEAQPADVAGAPPPEPVSSSNDVSGAESPPPEANDGLETRASADASDPGTTPVPEAGDANANPNAGAGASTGEEGGSADPGANTNDAPQPPPAENPPPEQGEPPVDAPPPAPANEQGEPPAADSNAQQSEDAAAPEAPAEESGQADTPQ
jgi:hypothetical protein